MKISVITPSFNQAKFLPFNLASVRVQQGVKIEHIVVDPGSKDGSTEIARQAPGVILINEPDRGQSNGISKGFSRSTGDILVWLNSDDFYPDEHVLSSVMKCFQDNPEVDIVYGDVNFVDEVGKFLRKGFINKDSNQLLDSFQYQVGIVQPGVFWRRRVFEEIGGPSEEFEYCMDYELWVRMASKGYKWKFLPKTLAHHRWWSGMKTSSRRDLSLIEHFKVCDRYFGYVHWKWIDRYADYLCSKQDGVVNYATSIPVEEKKAAIIVAIDKVITQEMLRKLNQTVEQEQVATLQYIEKNYPSKKRIYFERPEFEIITEYSDDSKAQQRVAWNIFDVKTASSQNMIAYHVPDNFDRYFDSEWHAKQINRSQAILEKLARDRRGDVCVVVGNGPSLCKSDLSLLEHVDSIISNFAGLSLELSRYSKILTVVNDLVAKQGAIDFNTCDLIKFVPFWLANYFNEDASTFFVNATVRPEFGIDFALNASWRSTVSFFNLQLAYAIGYKKVLLIGFDHSYIQPQNIMEGVVLTQIDDDENHFDPRYFKGKDWQAADTSNMEKMYVVARDVYEKDGREIVNCTIGGLLERFRRGDLAEEICVASNIVNTSKPVFKSVSYPRLLMIDSTPVGHPSATGQLKQAFLGDWPKDSFLQISEQGGQNPMLHLFKIGQPVDNSYERLSVEALIERCKSFNPDVIYFRPIDSYTLFNFAERIISQIDKPLVIHMMDDWPERLRNNDIEKYVKMDAALSRVIGHANSHLSICEAMSSEYKTRYGADWFPVANGVDLSVFPVKKWFQRTPVSQARPFVIRYMGALADDMTYASVKDIAVAVASLRVKFPVCFEIYTMDWCRSKAELDIGILPGVSISGLVDKEKYHQYLCEADALVIAYNFDQKSINYIGLSLANKMPECLASGVPLLAYGPVQVATINFLKKANCAQVVDTRDQHLLCSAIKTLILQPEHCQKLGESGLSFATKRLTKTMVENKFYKIITSASNTMVEKSVIIGPFVKDMAAHYDETDCISHLFSTTLSGAVMIDVGAHYGNALTPFLNKGWKIFAFEPDENNRQKLLERLEKIGNAGLVKLDARAISDKHSVGLPFYSSEESTGVSGLSAFLPSHKTTQKVDTVTLTEVLADETIAAIDFLKIDTEGYDLFVLKGFPWERFKPAVIECEFEDTKTVPLGYTFHEMAGFLMDKGYQVYVSEWHPIVRYGIRHNWKCLMRYPCQLTNEKAWGNLLAFRDPIDEAIVVQVVKKELKLKQKDPTEQKLSAQNNGEKQKINQSKPNTPVGSQFTSLNYSESIKKPLIKSLYRRFANYIVDRYPAIGRIGLFGIWSIRAIKRRILGLSGLILLLLAGFFAAAYFLQDYRWLFISSGGVVILLFVGGLGIAYARYLFRSYRDIQCNVVQLQISQAINDSQVKFETRFKTEMQKMHKELNQTIKASEQMSNKELQDKSEELVNELKQNETKSKTEMQKMHKELNQTIKASEQMSNKEHQALIEFVKKSLEKSNNESKQALENSEKVLTAHMDLISKANFLNAGIYQDFNRYLQNKDIQKILDFWLPILDLRNQNRKALGYMAHSICQIENISSGRLATNVQDAILRILVAQSITSRRLEVMEIGSLFGISMAAIYDNCRGHFDQIHLTAIDPLEGYYNKSAYDISTKVPINRALFEHNMRVSDIPKKDVTLIQALSTGKQAQETAQKRSYNVLIIDGDHSYDGVKFDFDNYHQMVKQGGYIIFDDYNCKEWPDVTKFVDSEVKTKIELEMVGYDWRTAVFKVKMKQKILKGVSK